jgi:hypothetical protein
MTRTKRQYQPPALKKLGLEDAHELNNDSTIIVGECDLLANLLEEEPDALARVQVIKTTAIRMAERVSARPSPAQ